MEANRWYIGDAFDLAKQLPDNFVQCIVTSPPYWGLRDYGIDGQLGLEKTPEEYVEKMVALFRELRRGLRDDGTLWLNMGDSYAHSGATGGGSPVAVRDYGVDEDPARVKSREAMAGIPAGLKPKDLCGIPWRVAFALQADGWYLRQDIIWEKPNPMPESVTDRCTKAHEYLFLLTKSPKYFYDNDAIREPHGGEPKSGGMSRPEYEDRKWEESCDGSTGNRPPMTMVDRKYNSAGRNRRSVWTIPTAPYPNAHFATFPPKLVEPCIQAGTSAEGCCPKCGAPYKRILERKESIDPIDYEGKHRATNKQAAGRRILANVRAQREAGGDHDNPFPEKKTIGFEPQCNHDEKPIGCIVLDPFAGSGTTLEVAHKFGRRWIGFELSEEYAKLIESRMKPLIRQGTLF